MKKPAKVAFIAPPTSPSDKMPFGRTQSPAPSETIVDKTDDQVIKELSPLFNDLANQYTKNKIDPMLHDRIIPICSDDFILKPGYRQYIDNESSIFEILNAAKDALEKLKANNTPKNRNNLIQTYKKGIADLSGLVPKTIDLKKRIIERLEFIAPKEPLSPLTKREQDLKKSFDNELECLALTICTFDNNNSDTADLTIAPLLNALKAIESQIDNKLPAYSHLLVRMREHLTNANKPLIATEAQKLMTAAKTGDNNQSWAFQSFKKFANTITTSSMESPDTKSQKHILIYHSLIAEIKALPIRESKVIDIVRTKEKANTKAHEALLKRFTALNSLLEATLKNLNNPLCLMPSESPANEAVTNARKLIDEIQNNSIPKLLKRLEAFKTDMSTANESSNLDDKISNIQSIIENTQTTVANMELALTTKILPSAVTCREAWTSAYNQKRDFIVSDLKTRLPDAKGALSIDQDNADLKRLIHEAEHFTSTDKETIDALSLRKNTLVSNIELEISSIKRILKDSLDIIIGDLKNTTDSYSTPKISKTNPFKTQVESARVIEINALSTLTEHLKSLTNTDGQNLLLWKTTNETHQLTLMKATSNRLKLTKSAETYELRLNNHAYQTSLSVIQSLNEEYLRILVKRNRTAVTVSSNEIDAIKDKLDKINPRLYKINRILLALETTNANYINSDLTLLQDADYIQQLKKTITNHLQNDKMEDLSEGRRGKFIQWLRVNVLKPIQKIFNHNKPYVTFFASHTEAKLIQLGAELNTKIAAPAA